MQLMSSTWKQVASLTLFLRMFPRIFKFLYFCLLKTFFFSVISFPNECRSKNNASCFIILTHQIVLLCSLHLFKFPLKKNQQALYLEQPKHYEFCPSSSFHPLTSSTSNFSRADRRTLEQFLSFFCPYQQDINKKCLSVNEPDKF